MNTPQNAGFFLFQYFEHPENFKLIFALPCIAALFIYHFCTQYPVIKRLLYRDAGTGKLHDDGLAVSYFFSCTFFLVFIICSILALASPRLGKRLVREYQRGADVVLAFDISRSMMLNDVYDDSIDGWGAQSGNGTQSRLERAAALAENLVYTSMEGVTVSNPQIVMPVETHIRYALAIGKGHGYLAIPLTSDTESILAMLRALSPSVIAARGTNLEELVDAAAAAFDGIFAAAKIIVLFSDGDSLAGSLSAAAARAKENNIILYTVGLGSAAGVQIPGESMAYTSSLHADVLSVAANLTHGAYIDGNVAGARADLLKITEARQGSSWNYREEAVPVWHLFLCAALAAFLLSKLCGKRLKVKLPPSGPAAKDG
ncbi:MAG: VWA domain-containing protein [Spirochaetaceae bacterium]|jgi:Ca-activated chloride channel family protein|nr:VWA domain-containing protein [Spirochaetaceae bacterium]